MIWRKTAETDTTSNAYCWDQSVLIGIRTPFYMLTMLMDADGRLQCPTLRQKLQPHHPHHPRQ